MNAISELRRDRATGFGAISHRTPISFTKEVEMTVPATRLNSIVTSIITSVGEDLLNNHGAGHLQIDLCGTNYWLGTAEVPKHDFTVAVFVPANANVLHPEMKHRYKLTDREAEVAILLARRQSNKEIARTLGFTVFTAERHTERVLAKLGINSRRHVQSILCSAK